MSEKKCHPPCEHKVEHGDTFYKLAVACYGDGSHENVKKIEHANPGVNPENLHVGQLIKIPA